MGEAKLRKPLSKQFDKALVYAHKLHRRQARKGSQVPYVAHLIGVASIVLEYGGDETQAIAALLHDAVEDQGVSASKIRKKFGKKVAAIVEGCTDSDTKPGKAKPPWLARKKEYVAHIRKAPAATRFVSAADKLYNARTIAKDYRAVGDKVWKRFTADKAGVRWYYRALVKAFRAAGTNDVVEELARVVGEFA